ncbi:hypothetical protein DBR42_12780 [Pelomonas sp. HMWF004]|nr:hypothetical protein DBR42_12780 [Pelomonas sp. HMWF004]
MALNDLNELTRVIALGSVERARDLLAAGCDPNRMDASGEFPLAVAAVANNVELLELLSQHGAAIDGFDDLGWTALHFAVDYAIDAAIKGGGRPGDERIEAIEAIEWLVRNGADVKAQAVDGTRPTDIATEYGSERVLGALCKGRALLEQEQRR